MEISKEMQDFIWVHRNSDPSALRLKYMGKHLPFDVDFAIAQIECRKKTVSKLPGFIRNTNFLFPSVVSAEQSTNETIASFHASLVKKGSRVMDMTCGLGIDDYFILKVAAEVLTFDINERNAEICSWNFDLLGVKNISVFNEDSIQWLKENPKERFDTIFADPSRRGDFNSRLYALSDCSPDIPKNLELIKKHADRLLIKVSPMLDIHQINRELTQITHIWVLSVKNECKELLVECDFKSDSGLSPLIETINFTETSEVVTPTLCFRLDEKLPDETIFEDSTQGLIGCYLFIPDSSIIKSGGASIVAGRYDLIKLHPNSWLYISENIHKDFPGRILMVKDTFSLGILKKGKLKGERRNVLCRNFPLSPSELVRLSKVKEGSDSNYLIGTTLGRNKKTIVLDCVIIH